MDCKSFLNLFQTLIELASFFKQISKDIILSIKTNRVCGGGRWGEKSKEERLYATKLTKHILKNRLYKMSTRSNNNKKKHIKQSDLSHDLIETQRLLVAALWLGNLY